jgi:hypothetical protein
MLLVSMELAGPPVRFEWIIIRCRSESMRMPPLRRLRTQDAAQSAPSFVELPLPSAGSGECIVELEDGGGAKMRVHLKGVAAPDLAGLSRSFWSRQS